MTLLADMHHEADLDAAYYAELRADEERELRQKLDNAKTLVKQMKQEGRTPYLLNSYRKRVEDYEERLRRLETA